MPLFLKAVPQKVGATLRCKTPFLNAFLISSKEISSPDKYFSASSSSKSEARSIIDIRIRAIWSLYSDGASFQITLIPPSSSKLAIFDVKTSIIAIKSSD